jgi:hypothetical protein
MMSTTHYVMRGRQRKTLSQKALKEQTFAAVFVAALSLFLVLLIV